MDYPEKLDSTPRHHRSIFISSILSLLFLLLFYINAFPSIFSIDYFCSPLSQLLSSTTQHVHSSNTSVPNIGVLLQPEKHVFREPTTIHHRWNITKDRRSPDRVEKYVYLINGMLVGILQPYFKHECSLVDPRSVSRPNAGDEVR